MQNASWQPKKGRLPQKCDFLKCEDNIKNEDYNKYEDDLKNEDNIKNKDYNKYEDDLKKLRLNQKWRWPQKYLKYYLKKILDDSSPW